MSESILHTMKLSEICHIDKRFCSVNILIPRSMYMYKYKMYMKNKINKFIEAKILLYCIMGQ